MLCVPVWHRHPSTEQLPLPCRCEEGIGREQGNSAMLQALRESTMASLSSMQASISEAAQQQTQRFQGLVTLVSGFLQQKDASLHSLQACPHLPSAP